MEVSETISETIEAAETNEPMEGVGVPIPVGAVEHQTADAVHYENCSCVEALRRVEVFADLPFEQLEWFIENADERVLEAGEILFRKGDAADTMVIYLEGEVHASRSENALDGYVYIARAGEAATEVSGRLPFSRMKEIKATGRAVVKTRVLLFPVELFPELIVRMPVLAERLVWIMTDRVRETTQADERRDKLMALGKLSAGLAHELNNPAAARRTSDELMQTLESLRVADLNLCRHNLTHEQREELSGYECAAISETAENSPNANALFLSDREDELTAWLEKRGIENAWELASTLADSGISVNKLEKIAADFAPEAVKDVLTRIVVQITVSRQASEIKTSVTRISDLVGAIKEYSYMDQAAIQNIDLHKGLDNTLLILKHKLKSKSVTVVREYAANLPKITAHGSLLNQVWTNLIDNAVDAMPSSGGRLKIMTRLEPEDVLVEIRDNGAGIPPEIQSRIFEPFYTTKPVNEGTGLGLDAVARIVRKHHGNVRFETKPGDTCFQVRLPLTQK